MMKSKLKSKLYSIGIFYLLLIIFNSIFAFLGHIKKSSGIFNSIDDFLLPPLIICFLLFILSIRSDKVKYIRLYLMLFIFYTFLFIFYAFFYIENLVLKYNSIIEFVYTFNIMLSQLHAILINYSSSLNIAIYRIILFWILSFSIIAYLYIINVLTEKIRNKFDFP